MIFIQAVDNQFYTDPIICGTNWYLQCNDEDGCIVFVKCHAKTSEDSARRRAVKALKGVNLKVKIKECLGTSQTTLPPNYTDLITAISFNVILKSPIPVPVIYRNVVSSPHDEYPFIAWDLEFDREDIEAVFKDEPINKLLTLHLTGSIASDRKYLRKLLRRQVNLKDLPERITIASKITN